MVIKPNVSTEINDGCQVLIIRHDHFYYRDLDFQDELPIEVLLKAVREYFEKTYGEILDGRY
jgi:hypothetical protein